MNGVTVVQRVLPPYRVGVFRHVRSKFDDFQLVFGNPLPDESVRNVGSFEEEWAVKRRNTYLLQGRPWYYTDLSGVKLDGRVVFINAELSNLNLPRLFAARRRRNFRVVLWTFGYDPARGFRPKRVIRDHVRLRLYEHADAVLFYWTHGRDVVLSQSDLPREKLFVAPNTLDTRELLSVKSQFQSKGRLACRRELGLSGAHFVYVGRLVADKEVDRLLLAWVRVRAELCDATLSIIGDGPERANLLDLCSALSLRGVTFHGGIVEPEGVGRLIFASDAVVIPGRLGLAVVHAFSFETPIISQDKGEWFHGEGIGYLVRESNCLIVPDGDIDGLSQAMIRVARDSELQQRLRDGAWVTLTQRAMVEHMAAGFEEAADYAWVAPRKAR